MNARSPLKVALTCASAGFLSGCATLFNPQPQAVHIAATDAGRSVSVAARIQGRDDIQVQLPAVVPLTPKPGRATTVTIEDPCYRPSATRIDQSVATTTYLNFVNYFVGLLIDYSSGAMWVYDSPVQIPLARVEGCATAANNAQATVTVVAPETLPSAHQPRRHNMHVGINYPLAYAMDGKGGGRTLGAGGSLGYEHLFSHRFGVTVRMQGASIDSYQDRDWVYGSIGGMTLMLNHYFARLPGVYAGVGVAARNLNLNYYHYTTVQDPQGFSYSKSEITTVSNEMGHAMLTLGWRSTRGSLYVGADAQITSPALLFYNIRHTDDLSAVPAGVRAEMLQKRDKMLHANQFNLFVGVAF